MSGELVIVVAIVCVVLMFYTCQYCINFDEYVAGWHCDLCERPAVVQTIDGRSFCKEHWEQGELGRWVE